MRPIARLETELRASGLIYAVLGAVGLVGSLARDTDAARAVVAFVVAAVILGAVSWLSTRWLRAADAAPAAPDAAPVEPSGLTVRRVLVGLSLPLVAVVASIALSAGLAAVLGGVVAGIGAIDLLTLSAVRRRQGRTGGVLYRELGGSPFAGGRRPLYTRPI